MAVNYSILCDVDFDVKKTQKKLNDTLKGVKGLKINIGAGKAAKEMRDLDKSAADTLLTFQAANSVFRKSVDIIESMVEQVFKLDDALTEFRKISDLSGASLDRYVEKLSVMGQATGRTISEMVSAATSFRKNGFNDEDAAQLGQIATLYQNISDETISAAESADMIISQMIAFDIQAEDAIKILDQINEVSNNFSISSGDLARSLGVVSASSSAMGNSLNETISLMTGITEITRNSSKAARGNVFNP